MSEIPRPWPQHRDAGKAFARQYVTRPQGRVRHPFAALVEMRARDILLVPDDEENPVRPYLLEIFLRVGLAPHCGVADQHATIADTLDDDEVAVAVFLDEHDGWYAGRGELVQARLDAVRAIAAGLQIQLHVEQRKAFAANQRLVAALEHSVEDLRLRDRVAIVVGEQGRDRGGSAAEVVSLPNGGGDPGFLDASHLDRERAARKAGVLQRPGAADRQRRARQHCDDHRADTQPHRRSRLRMVAFWMMTLLPEL